MITRLEISGLFDLYSYDLKFEDDAINIITGPNGYGKTTILRIINSLYTKDFESLMNLRFKKLIYHFDGKVLSVKQTIDSIEEGDSSDLPTENKVSLDFQFYSESDGNAQPYAFTLTSDEKELTDSVTSGGFELFMNSRQCFFISDDRLVSKKTDTINSSLPIASDLLSMDIGIFKSLLCKYGFGDEEKQKLHPEFYSKVEVFKSIIANSYFADKTMQISLMYGIRFQSHNPLKEFIDIQKLSSGEKHILIQTLELLFIAKDGMVAMVDEPELSFHPAWLNQYIPNIEKIQKVKALEGKRFQVILATHSPSLIGQRWDKCIDLYENRL